MKNKVPIIINLLLTIFLLNKGLESQVLIVQAQESLDELTEITDSTIKDKPYSGQAKAFVGLHDRIDISKIEFEPSLPDNYKVISRAYEWDTDNLGKYDDFLTLKDSQGEVIDIPIEIWVLAPATEEDVNFVKEAVEMFIQDGTQKDFQYEINGYLKHEKFSRIVNSILNNGSYMSSITYEVEHVLNYSFSSDGSVTTSIEMKRSNHHSDSQEQAVSDYVQEKIVEWGLDDPALSDVDKVGIVHDKIIFNAAYVTESVTGYQKGGQENFDKINDVSIHSPYAITEYGLGVCQSYASLFQKFCEELDIPSYYVLGTRNIGSVETHSWNKVQLDGQWYNIDLTWDDPLLGGAEEAPYSGVENWKYFLKSDETFKADHTFTTGKDIFAPSDYRFEE